MKAKRTARPVALLLVAALVPLLMFAVGATIVSLRSERTALEEQALAEARRVSEMVDSSLQRQLDLVAALTHLPALDSPADLPGFAETLRREQIANPLWLTALLAEPDGKVLVATRAPRGMVVDPEDFHRVVQQRVPLVGNIARGAEDLALPVRAPVIRGGVVRYVVVAAIRPAAIREQVLSVAIPPEWVAATADGSGRLVARTRGGDAMLAQPVNAAAMSARARGGSGIYSGSLREGELAVGAYYVSPTTGWTAYVIIPRSVFNAPLRHALWLAVGGGAVSVALAGTFVALLLRELRLRRQEAALLENAQRLEALGRLTGGVAHDFNNLLAIVSGNLELLERRLPGAAQNRQVTAIRSAVERGVSLTRGLLTFSRGGDGQGTIEDVNVLLRGVFGMMRETVGGAVEATLDLQDSLPRVMLDRVQFDLALLNLAANARDAMPRGGALHITTRRAKLDSGPPGVAISVRDTGSGIPADVLPRVFEPFFTTKDIDRGTGLGLAQVYGFARNAGGEARIASRSGEGTTVTILLPECTAPAAAERPPAQLALPPQPATTRILLVDDNAAVREMTALSLREHFDQVDEAANAASALAMLEAGGFSAVVSDIVMPGATDGIGLAREIRRRWPELGIVLVSGYAASAGEARALAVPVLAKPLEPGRLALTVRQEIAVRGRPNPTGSAPS
jgi:signal transduction histidine kinase/ActR/RegA family two-component response regulator